jgi:hypothetical protein
VTIVSRVFDGMSNRSVKGNNTGVDATLMDWVRQESESFKEALKDWVREYAKVTEFSRGVCSCEDLVAVGAFEQRYRSSPCSGCRWRRGAN